MKYERILVAVDGSDGSKQAVESAVELAGKSSKNLTLIHVFKESRVAPVYGLAGVGYVNPELVEDELKEIEMNEKNQGGTILKKAKADVESMNLNIHVKTELLEGDAAKIICDYAELNHIDLILIGDRGLSGIRKLVLGSVSKKVTSDADCSVLVVK